MSTPAAPLPIDVSVPVARWTWWRSGWPPLLLALGGVASYALFIALPYYVNGLDAYGPDELTAGQHPPEELWPYTRGPAWASFRLAGMATFYLGPAVAIAAGGWAAARVRQGIAADDVRQTAPALVAAAVGVGTVAWLFSPSGSTMLGWFLG